jgi:hypothetical protein
VEDKMAVIDYGYKPIGTSAEVTPRPIPEAVERFLSEKLRGTVLRHVRMLCDSAEDRFNHLLSHLNDLQQIVVDEATKLDVPLYLEIHPEAPLNILITIFRDMKEEGTHFEEVGMDLPTDWAEQMVKLNLAQPYLFAEE